MEITSLSSSSSPSPLHRSHFPSFNGRRRHPPLFTTPLRTKSSKPQSLKPSPHNNSNPAIPVPNRVWGGRNASSFTPKPSPHNHNNEQAIPVQDRVWGVQNLSSLTSKPSPHTHNEPGILDYRRGRDVPSSDTHRFTHSATQPLHLQNPISLLKTLRNLARNDDLVSAMSLLDYLDTRHIPVTTTAYSDLISAVIRAKSESTANRVAAHVRRSGMDKNEFLRAKLVTMFASCGMVDEAKRVFEDCRHRGGVYLWNALLRGNVVAGGRRYENVVGEVERMRESGVELNEYSVSCLIKGLAGGAGKGKGKGKEAFKEGLKVHGLLIKNGWIGRELLKTCLIDLYSKCGKIGIACRVFEELEDRDVVAWGALIAGLAHNGVQQRVVEYVRVMLEEGFEMNMVVLATVLPVIGVLGARSLGEEFHGYVVKMKGCSQHAFVQSALVDMYCKCGDMESAKKVFNDSKERSLVSWTALISGYCANGMHWDALKSMICMQREGFRPDIVTLVTLVPACTKLRALKQGKEIHGFALKNNMLNMPLTSSLMALYSKCDSLGYGLRLFKGMDQRNVKIWTGMMDSLLENGCLHEALDVFRSLLLSEHRPDSITVSRVLEICAELQAMNLGKEIHVQVLKKNLEFSPFVSAGIMKMYSSCGFLDKASLFFNLIPYPEIITQTAMIEIYGYHGQFDKAIAFFYQMVASGSTPSHITWKVVLSVCDQAGFTDEACRTFELMTSSFGATPSEEHYSTMAQLLTRAGRVEEAENYRLRSSC